MDQFLIVPCFFEKIFNTIPELTQHNLIIGGGLNCRLDPYLDRSSRQWKIKSQSSELLNAYIDTSNIKDVWRIENPTGREYSFYSPVHKTYSRIDYFLIDSKLIQFTYNSKYHNIIISDHAPLTFMIKLNGRTEKQSQWRLNPQILKENVCQEYLTKQINMFFETNDHPGTSASLLWETFKAFARGAMISSQAFHNKDNRVKHQALERELRQLDIENAAAPTMIKHNKIAALKYKLN